MPLETRWFVKASLAWLAAAFVLGAVMLSAKALSFSLHDFSAVHAHMAFVGWLVNLVMGISLWFLPVNRQAFPENRGRYPVAPARLAFVLLNLGLLLRVVAEPMFDVGQRSTGISGVLVLSALAQMTAVIIFIQIAWHRVRAA